MDKKPNVVLIMFDHQLYYKHAYGSNRVKLPKFDEFLEESTLFENAFSVSPLCGPARRSILDGLYPHEHGQIVNQMTAVSERTYFDVINERGYDSYYFGKWHAGKGQPSDFGCKGFSPKGYNNPYVHDDYRQYVKERGLPMAHGLVEFSESDVEYFPISSNVDLSSFPQLYTLTFGRLTTPEDTHECFYLANRACEAIRSRNRENADKPFMIRVDFWGPHQPYFPTEKYLDMYDAHSIDMYGSFYDDLKDKPAVYRNENAVTLSKNHEIIYPNPQTTENWQKMLRYAYATNTMCDAAAGRIIETLKEEGLYDDTIVIWSADHGDALGSHGGHIDKNCYLSEEVCRIPLAVHNPFGGKVRISRSLVSNLDIPATIVDACGNETIGNEAKSLLDFTKNDACGREYFVIETHGHFQPHFGRGVCYQNYRYVYNKDMIDELYDLESDPYELNNLINDPNYEDVKQKLKGFLREWQEKTNDTII